MLTPLPFVLTSPRGLPARSPSSPPYLAVFPSFHPSALDPPPSSPYQLPSLPASSSQRFTTRRPSSSPPSARPLRLSPPSRLTATNTPSPQHPLAGPFIQSVAASTTIPPGCHPLSQSTRALSLQLHPFNSLPQSQSVPVESLTITGLGHNLPSRSLISSINRRIRF